MILPDPEIYTGLATLEDHLGNIYVCGFNSKAAVTDNRLIVKLNKKELYYGMEIASPWDLLIGICTFRKE